MTYTSSDPTIATVDATTGEVTGVKAGKATITATMECGTKTVGPKTTEVTVKAYELQSVEQKKADTIEAVVLGATKDLKATDFDIKSSVGNRAVAVKSVAVDAVDATKVTLVTFAKMDDAATYTVTLDGVAKEFVATDGVVADVSVSPVQIPANTDGTDIYGQTLDKNNVVISEFTVNKDKPANVDFVLETSQGYVDGDKLVLPAVGNKGTAEITCHTYKYDETGNEIGAITKKVEIVAVEDTPATVSNYKYTIDPTGAAANWEKTNNQLSVSDDSAKVFFEFKDSKGNDVTGDYKVVSSNDSILLLPKSTAATAGVDVKAVKEGNVYINVMDKTGKVVESLPVVVVAARKLNSITLDKSMVTISNIAGLTETVNVKAFDQYGQPMAGVTLATEVLNSNANITDTGDSATNVVIGASGVTAGTYTLKVTATKGTDTQSRTISVKVVETTLDKDTATDLRLVLSENEIDMAVAKEAKTTDTDIEKTVKIQVVAYDQGAKVGVLPITGAAVTINGKKVTDDYSSIYVDDPTVGDEGVKINVVSFSSPNVSKNLTSGTYVVKVKANDKDFTGSFTVKDTQAAASATIVKNVTTATVSATPNTSEVGTVLTECITFSYNGTIYGVDGSAIAVTDCTGAKNNGESTYIGTVIVTVESAPGSDTAVKYNIPIVINTTFTK